ncbi:DUF4230 domain-containing protein [Leptolyngbya sp. AN03gr2]|uniref:DUF4230 domain-containing protein n=1 Tax=unclassified Leptolyngbya TaxID=2650499 RepID=UPI003D311DAA
MLTWGTWLGQKTGTLIAQILQKLGWQAIALLTILMLGLFSLPFLLQPSATHVDVRNLIFSGLNNVDQLTTVTIDAKATVRVEKPSEVWGLQVGQTNFVYEGVSQVQAGINLKRLEVKSVSADAVHLSLPAPYVREIGLNVGHSTILANYRDWFAPKATPELQEQAQLKAIAAIRQEACKGGILEAANQSAKQLLTDVLTKLGYTMIQIDTQLPKDSICG